MGAVSGEEVEEVLDELSWLVLVKQVTGVNRDESCICELLDEFGQVLLGNARKVRQRCQDQTSMRPTSGAKQAQRQRRRVSREDS